MRPTSDKVREALFNILAHGPFGDFDGARVLDLFAGTGALGLEALSRGARFVLLVDDHLESRAIIRRNVEALHATGATKIWRRGATQLGPMPPNAGGPFDLVFCDPPYRQGLAAPALVSAREGGWLAPGALCVVEAAAEEEPVTAAGFEALDSRTWGDTRAEIFRLEG